MVTGSMMVPVFVIEVRTEVNVPVSNIVPELETVPELVSVTPELIVNV